MRCTTLISLTPVLAFGTNGHASVRVGFALPKGLESWVRPSEGAKGGDGGNLYYLPVGDLIPPSGETAPKTSATRTSPSHDSLGHYLRYFIQYQVRALDYACRDIRHSSKPQLMADLRTLPLLPNHFMSLVDRC